MAPGRLAALAVAVTLGVTGCADGGRRAGAPAVAAAPAAGAARPRSAADGPEHEVGTFSPAASLASPRALHTATVLQDGRVLVTGGFDGHAILQDAELYDPVTDTWTASTALGEEPEHGLMMNGAVATARQTHTATLLPASSQVLLAGGLGVERLAGGQPIVEALHTSFLFDPVTNRFVRAGPLSVARFWHLATVLHDGRALVVGGFDERGQTSLAAEAFDPTTRRWSRVGPTAAEHAWGAIATTPGSTVGRTIVHAGASVDVRRALFQAGPAARTERFDAASDAFALGPANLLGDIVQMATAPLPDGRVLFAGGRVPRGPAGARELVATGALELYDPTLGEYVAGPTLGTVRYAAEVAAIGRGDAQLVVGGFGASGAPLAACEVWAAATNTLRGTVSLRLARAQHRAVTLKDGRILVVGGVGPSGEATDACEVHERPGDVGAPPTTEPAAAPAPPPSGP